MRYGYRSKPELARQDEQDAPYFAFPCIDSLSPVIPASHLPCILPSTALRSTPSRRSFISIIASSFNITSSYAITSPRLTSPYTITSFLDYANMSASSSSSSSRILFLSLDHQAWSDDDYSHLLDAVTSKAKLQRAKMPESALKYLADNVPRAIFATDSAITKKKYAAVLRAVVSYVLDGGTLVLGATFSTFVIPTDLTAFFAANFGLPWKSGSYHRTDVHLNEGVQGLATKGLADVYSQKALFLKGVPPDAALYLPSKDSKTQSHVFAPAPVDVDQTPVAFTQVGKGWLGYLGDVNQEHGTDAVALAMCRL